MSADLNAVGTLIADVEVIEAIGLEGQKVANIVLACRQGKGTEFITFTAWNGVAETIAKHTRKGSKLQLQGAYKTKSWVDEKTQTKHSRIYFVVEKFELISKKLQEETLIV